MRNEKGSIVVEATLSFTLFTLALVFFINLITMVTLQSRVEYALHQTAKEISTIAYVYEITKLSESFEVLQKNIDEYVSAFNGSIDKVDDYIQNDDISDFLQNLKVYIILEDSAIKFLARDIFEGYLKNGKLTADNYLKAYHVENGLMGMDFSKTSFSTATGIIDLTVEYTYKNNTLNLPIFQNGIKLRQRAVTRVWQNGDGTKFNK